MSTITTEQIVIKAGNGNVIHQFESIAVAVKWAEQRRSMFGDRSPKMTITRVIITRKEEEIIHV